ncbi:MAG TPA: hypothetical protein PKU98_07840 [Saprospiraceae bacterium]|nr:hypothetical protein [Saprospiraceae bacterium]HNG06399.1 hypothetical protein [Saprospiraceae bacterium]
MEYSNRRPFEQNRRPYEQNRRPQDNHRNPNTFAILELKYGNIYGGPPNYFVISDVALLVFDPEKNHIFLESLSLNSDVDVVFVNSKVNELGHTIGRHKHVVNLSTRKKKPYLENFEVEKNDLENAFANSRPSKKMINNFFFKNFKKYNINKIITFDGRRDIFLCEKAGVKFNYIKIEDLQQDLNRECNYLFSLNKLGVAINFRNDASFLYSNNLKYYLHPIAARQIEPKSAAFDAARLLMVYNEFTQHKENFLLKAALLLNKIQQNTVPE